MQYESTTTVSSGVIEGVRFTIARMTFGRRIELMRRVRQLSARLEFARAGAGAADAIEASLLGAEIDELYLRWGLTAIEGLDIDGRAADGDSLITAGPEPLCREIIAAVKRECSLTDEERKN
jgi:hypothetical protein